MMRKVVADVREDAVRRIVDRLGAEVVNSDSIHGQEVDVFAPCALGAVINDQTVPEIRARLICGLANNQLADPRHGVALQQRGIVYVPDYVVNAGGMMGASTVISGSPSADPARSQALGRSSPLWYDLAQSISVCVIEDGGHHVKTIVAGVTDSPTANEAARQAAELARDLGARLHLVSAVSDRAVTTVTGGGESWSFSSYDSAKTHMAGLRGVLGDGVEYTTAVVDSDPAEALCAEAERLDADLIVVGSVRTQGIGRVLGSVANDVLRKTPCAVLVAKTT